MIRRFDVFFNRKEAQSINRISSLRPFALLRLNTPSHRMSVTLPDRSYTCPSLPVAFIL
jgi:hypothetical protein